MQEPIVDRSPEQKQDRVNRLSSELRDLGYSVVKADWLQSVLIQNKRKTFGERQ